MTQLLCLCAALAALEQEPVKSARSVELPNSPVFQESGAKFTLLGRNLWLKTNAKRRQVIIRTVVCRQKAALEEFMCLKGTKEHEAIVTADVVPRHFHAALLAAGAKAGSVAKFEGEFLPPTGDKLEISVEWKDGKQ